MARTTDSASTFCPAESRIYVLVAAILASAMGFIDGSVVSIALPAIRADIGATFSDAQWVANGYMLFLASLLLLGGAAGDRFGLRRTFSAGIALFVVASIAAALAPTPLLLIVARAVQGVGAAFMVPGSLAIIAKAYPRDRRGWAIGIWAASSSLTTILGPVVGGFVLTALGDWSWRLVFGINLLLGGVALFLLWTRVPDDPAGAGRRLDVVGGILVTLGLFGLAFGLTGTGEDDVPALSHVVLYGGAGFALLVAFLVWEARAREPMMPLRLFRNVGFSGANALTLCLYFALSGITFFLPMTLIGGWGMSPAEVAIAFLPLGIALTLLSSWSGRLADRYGPAPLIAGGAFLVALSFAGLALVIGSRSLWLGVMPMMTLLGIGMGFVVSPLSTAVMTALDDEESGIASGVNNAVARVAGLLAVAICGALVAYVFAHALGPAAELPVFFGVVPESPLPPEVDAARIGATNAAFAAVAWFTAALSLLSAAIAWATQEKRLSGRPAPPAGGATSR
jgi:EmrB/QacA subfamily drug resistance transporter